MIPSPNFGADALDVHTEREAMSSDEIRISRNGRQLRDGNRRIVKLEFSEQFFDARYAARPGVLVSGRELRACAQEVANRRAANGAIRVGPLLQAPSEQRGNARERYGVGRIRPDGCGISVVCLNPSVGVLQLVCEVVEG
jgi:hypothetical protein